MIENLVFRAEPPRHIFCACAAIDRQMADDLAGYLAGLVLECEGVKGKD